MAAEVNRISAKYSPSIWGDAFLRCSSEERDLKAEKQFQKLKEEVKRMLMSPENNPSPKLELINDIQRLGVCRHFEDEIDNIVQDIHNQSFDKCDDLYSSALRFRLLRQQGYNISCEIFNKFKDEEGKFKSSLVNDIKGLLSLYEASHIAFHGDDILEEALSFSTTHLESAKDNLKPGPLSTQVTRALHQPFWKGLPRVEAWNYISIYHQLDSHNQTLLTLSKLDFNLVQQLHRKELSETTRWWNGLDAANKLPFARDRIVECHFWAMSICFEPEYSFTRKILCKVLELATVIDDIYDVYGTAEERERFNTAVDRWETSAIDTLPKEYLRVCYQALLVVFAELEEKLANEGNFYGIHRARDSMEVIVGGYNDEARWLHQKYTPTLKEYLGSGLSMGPGLATSFFVVSIVVVVGMGVISTKDVLDWLYSHPKIVRAAGIIGRLGDDIVTRKFEKQREHIASAVECYMKEHDGSTEEEAVMELRNQISDSWKDVNESICQKSSRIVPIPVLMPNLNIARWMEVIYKNQDVYTHNQSELMKGFIKSMFIEALPL